MTPLEKISCRRSRYSSIQHFMAVNPRSCGKLDKRLGTSNETKIDSGLFFFSGIVLMKS